MILEGGEGGGFLRVPMKLVNHKRITFKKLFENVFYYYIIYVSICKFFCSKIGNSFKLYF